MKDLVSSCEKTFLKNLIATGKRLDGREVEESRTVELVFGADHGCCLATLGNTRVFSQVSCEMTRPRSARPSEGQLQVSVEFTAMASAPSKDSGGRWSGSEINVQPSRQLERTLRESRCIDLESLCILAGEKVWSLKVAVYVLNHDGNVIECASIAALAALLHFRRPDVTVTGVDVVVHPAEERDPVPITLLHWPFSCTFAIYEKGEQIISDPVELEERVSEGCVVISMNVHQEVCMLHLGGHTALPKEKLLLCTSRAHRRVKHLTQTLKQALQDDGNCRSKGLGVGFASRLHTQRTLVTRHGPKELTMKLEDNSEGEGEGEGEGEEDESTVQEKPKIFQLTRNAVMLGEGGPSSWETLGQSNLLPLTSTTKKEEEEEEVKPKPKPRGGADSIELSSSEEEEVQVLNSMDAT